MILTGLNLLVFNEKMVYSFIEDCSAVLLKNLFMMSVDCVVHLRL